MATILVNRNILAKEKSLKKSLWILGFKKTCKNGKVDELEEKLSSLALECARLVQILLYHLLDEVDVDVADTLLRPPWLPSMFLYPLFQVWYLLLSTAPDM